MYANTWIDEAIGKAVARTRGIAGEVKDFPHIVDGGAWQCTPDGVWTGGFWAGVLWLAFERDGGDDLRRLAVQFTERLLPRASDTHNHDLGFMFFPSAIKAWSLTGQERYRTAAIEAASALAKQFNPSAGFIPGWGFFGKQDWSGWVLVDTLMNLPLLVWASNQADDMTFMDVVHAQVKKTLEHHFRPEGSVYHVYKFDPETGAPLGGDTYQGLGPESSWSRGQAWAITALAILASMTGDGKLQAASERVTRYFLNLLPDDGVPPWDFKDPNPRGPKDSSAGAIASYGFIKLYCLTKDRAHFDTAVRLLQALALTCGNGSGHGGLLLHATADLPHGLGVDGSTMYGDYYYLKSLVALRELSKE
jgi:unsaturated chondroitin disaccharide hydrolase